MHVYLITLNIVPCVPSYALEALSIECYTLLLGSLAAHADGLKVLPAVVDDQLNTSQVQYASSISPL